MFVILEVLFVIIYSGPQETDGQQLITLPVETNTNVDLPCSCSCSVSLDRLSSVQWFRSSNHGNEVSANTLAWWGGGRTGNSTGFRIKDNFSLVIIHVNLTNQGLYKCIVAPVGGGVERNCYVQLEVYANPYSPPLIEYSPQTNGIDVTCSVSHVFPPTFPKLTSYEGNGTTETNEDGTYNTSVSHLVPLINNDANIQCLYSNTNFKSMSSLLVSNCAGQPAIEDQVPQNESDSSTRCNHSGLWMVWVMLILEALILIIIVYLIKNVRKTSATDPGQGTRDETEIINVDNGHGAQPVDGSGNENAETPAMSSDRFVFGGKLYFPAIMITILAISVTDMILIIAYLATALILSKRDEKGSYCDG